MKSLSDPIAKITRAISAKHGFNEGRLLTQWPLIVGPALADYTCPIRVRYPNRQSPQGILVVQVEGAWSVEVKHLEPVIIDRITAFLGYPAITGLKIQQVPLGTLQRTAGDGNKKNVAKPTEDRENSTLDSALEHLAQTIRSNQSKR